MNLTLAPDVIGSGSGALAAVATVLNGNTELKGWTVKLHVDYADRNAAMHAIDDATDKSDGTGRVESAFTGLKWEGAGTLTASVLDAAGNPALDDKKQAVTAQATFSVLDESPPTLTITSPASGASIPRGNGLNVTVTSNDEIGVSQIYVQVATANGNTNLDRTRTTIATGATSVTGQFGFDTGTLQTATSVTIYAMSADMSNNLGVATPITVNVQ
ncbi:MAG: hypothetical protein ACXVCV_08795 [Polyangia bacterium]